MLYLFYVIAAGALFGGGYYVGYKYGYKVAAAEQKVAGALKTFKRSL